MAATKWGTRLVHNLPPGRYQWLGACQRENAEAAPTSSSLGKGWISPQMWLIQKRDLRLQLLSSANQPLSGKAWDISIFVCCLCSKPQGRQLFENCLFATVPFNLWTQAPVNTRARPSRGVIPGHIWAAYPGSSYRSWGVTYMHKLFPGSYCWHVLIWVSSHSPIGWVQDTQLVSGSLSEVIVP